MQAHVIRVHSPNGRLPPISRYAVLAPDAGSAMAAIIPELDLCDVAEATGEVLEPSLAEALRLTPGEPKRLV